MVYLGVRQHRSGGTVQQLLDVFDLTAIDGRPGARAMAAPWGPTADVSLPAALAKARALAAAGALLAIEGDNEPDANGKFTVYKGHTDTSNDFTAAEWLQRDLYAAVKADPVLRNYPVFDQTNSASEQPDVGLQFIEDHADYANIHPYEVPGNQLVDNGVFDMCDRSIPGGALAVGYGITSRNHYLGFYNDKLAYLPAVITECGILDGAAVTEEQRAAVALTCWLNGFRNRFLYTFFYQVKDDGALLGLYTASGLPKVSADIVHNFFAILDDTSNGTLGNLNYSIIGQGPLEHELLLQKSTGEFYLIVWRESFSGAVARTVDLGATYGTVNIYDPTAGTAPIQSWSGRRAVAIALGDHPLVIEIF